MQTKQILLLGAILSLLSVVIGAFGAHGLEKLLTENGRLETFETGVRYQFYHALGIILVGLTTFHFSHKFLKTAVWLMLIGILVFSGSLYILSISNVGKWGMITPLGGVSFILAWLFYILGVSKSDKA